MRTSSNLHIMTSPRSNADRGDVVCKYYLLSLHQPVGNIVDFNSLIAILGMPCAGNDHFGIGIPDLQQGCTFPLEGFRIGDVVADLNVQLFVSLLNHFKRVKILYFRKQYQHPSRFSSFPIAHKYRSFTVNVFSSGSPSRILRVLLISFGMTILPKSSAGWTI